MALLSPARETFLHPYTRSPKTHFRLVSLLLMVLLSACASLPEEFEQQPSFTWQHPEDTRLGKFIAETAPKDNSLSGVELLSEPDKAFSTRFAIASLAEHTLDMQYYLWKGDTTGKLLMWRALQAADRGVRVRFLIDDIYHSQRDEAYALLDAHHNFEVRVFNPIPSRGITRYLNFAAHKQHLNHRMHNKIFLADNAVAVLGGRNIGDDYFGVDTNANFVDLDVLTVGEGARQAGAAFDEYWNSKYAIPIGVLHDETFSEEDLNDARELLQQVLEEINALPFVLAMDESHTLENMRKWRDELRWVEARVVVDPLERFEGQGDSAIEAFAESHIAETHELFMAQSAYLIPSKAGIDNIRVNVQRGVRVMLLTNSLQSNNHITAHSGYLKYRKAIIETGAELYELRPDAALREHFRAFDGDHEPPAGIHTKSFVIDDEQVLIGSFNFDPRSRDLNSEIGLAINDPAFTEEVTEEMMRDFLPENAYRLFLNEKGKLRWEETHADGSATIHDHDPGAPLWRRMTARFLSWLPIEKDL